MKHGRFCWRLAKWISKISELGAEPFASLEYSSAADPSEIHTLVWPHDLNTQILFLSYWHFKSVEFIGRYDRLNYQGY